MIKYKSVQNVIDQLQVWIDDKQDQLSLEESKDYPSEDRIELIESQLQALEDALEALQNYEI